MSQSKAYQKLVHFAPIRLFIRKLLALACLVDKEQENIVRDRRKAPAAIFNTAVPDSVAAALDALPSETCSLERRYLYQVFSTIWDPSGDVLEIGPFLGGTTRAIAMGMMHHCGFRECCRLDTCDRFKGYYDRQALLDYLRPAFAGGLLSPSDRDAIGSSASFREVFERLHENEPYYRILNILHNPLPDRPEDVGMEGMFRADPIRHYTAVFVDGCKSWYSTKYLVKELLPCISPGCRFFFQDYGWFTCFWIPTFIARFPSVFEPFGYAEGTYAFTYRGNLSSEIIDASFPDTPHDICPDEFCVIFDQLAAAAAAEQNLRAEMMANLQHVASLAYCGHIDQARRRMIEIGGRWDFQNQFPSILASALTSPTYTPEKKIRLSAV
jgi:hypothetical protein